MIVDIIGDSEVRLWGLGGQERLRRTLAAFPEVRLADAGGSVPEPGTALVLRGDHHFDPRVVQALAAGDTPLLLAGEDGVPVAARGPAGQLSTLRSALQQGHTPAFADIPVVGSRDLVGGYDAKLLSHSPPRVQSISATNAPWLERELFAGAYKGVTDGVTKWLWPAPARAVTRWCVALGIQPNHVTVLSLVLAVVAGIAFYQGAFGVGLLAGWVMTFLDTVDGKLARVTVTSSRLGDILDHGLDLIHPPLWYLAWGLGLAASWDLTPGLQATLVLIFAAYLGGRLCEGAFHPGLAPFSMFVWRPFDSFNRLITARRNPNLILLTVGWAAGRPDLGLWAVMAWHVLSTGVLALRLAMALVVRRRAPLDSWLSRVGPGRGPRDLAVRTFTRLGDDGGRS
ncbi:MAG: CDP-alcohol phosphatidyltransferase family protein [Gammaproteobacteria bacterium]|nr:CDP-alcohol phosphatidyltransferase family protein [Gammaproteobacteria bacterium]